jgi:hypothetical protein
MSPKSLGNMKEVGGTSYDVHYFIIFTYINM